MECSKNSNITQIFEKSFSIYLFMSLAKETYLQFPIPRFQYLFCLLSYAFVHVTPPRNFLTTDDYCN